MRIAAAALLAAFVAATLWLFVLIPSGAPRNADAIVVLAGIRSRLDTGVRLYRAGVAPQLVISEDPGPWPRAERLCSAGAICFHAHPYSTQGEAEAFARLARAHGWRSVVLVSSRYHLRRARLLFGRCLGREPAVVAAHTGVSGYVRNVWLEWAKLAYQVTVARGC